MTATPRRGADLGPVEFDPGVRARARRVRRQPDDEHRPIPLLAEQTEQYERGEQAPRPPGSDPEDLGDDPSQTLRVDVDRGSAGDRFQLGDDVGQRLASRLGDGSQEV